MRLSDGVTGDEVRDRPSQCNNSETFSSPPMRNLTWALDHCADGYGSRSFEPFTIACKNFAPLLENHSRL